MKIGILTYHKSINYGSVLQAWALQQALEAKGFDVEIINYEPERYAEMYSLKGTEKSFIKQCKSIINKLPILNYLRIQINKFNDFRLECLKQSVEYFINSDFDVFNTKYQAIICGSDQVWNIRAKDCDSIYFLPIKYDGRKIAYAVSINDTDYTEKRANKALKDAMCDFDYISIREWSGVKKTEKFLGNSISINCDIDPTLLHVKTAYDCITSNRIIREPYIFLYNVWATGDVFEGAKILSKKYGLPVYTMFMTKGAIGFCKILKSGVKIICKDTSPKDFLSLIKYADYIVTDSFHGTAFSLIFEKKFVCINDKYKYDERIVNILNLVNLKNRLVGIKEIETFDIDALIDYNVITQKRLTIAQESLDRLIAAIG